MHAARASAGTSHRGVSDFGGGTDILVCVSDGLRRQVRDTDRNVCATKITRPVTPSTTFILSTHNRCATALETLSRINECGLNPAAFETIVVDNASTDGTPAAIEREFPEVRLIKLARNEGSVAKNHGLSEAAGKYVVFLDDDSFPLPGSIERMIRHFQLNPRLAAAGFTVTLPSGRRECSAYPNVFIGCGVGLRRSAINDVGPLPADFFMQAEEYDLSLRLLDADWQVQTFDDLHVHHAKSPATRSSRQKMQLDVRNNLLLVLRRFPDEWRDPYLKDWMTRYWAMASQSQRRTAAACGFAAGVARHLATLTDQPISDRAFEQFARINQTQTLMLGAARHFNLKRVVLVDWGKNLLAYRLACENAGVNVVAIADENFAGQHYGDWPIITDAQARAMDVDGAIVANLSPVHAAARLAAWRESSPVPVIDLFEQEREAAVAAVA